MRGRSATGGATAFPRLPLPFKLPYPPMEASRAEKIPAGDGWLFEPKWDGFRALVFRNEGQVVIQSKSGQPLARYFPELVDAFLALPAKQFVLDGEIVIQNDGQLSFDDLLLRLHPAESRIRRLAEESPAKFFAFDILFEPVRGRGGRDLSGEPLSRRRERLETFLGRLPEDGTIRLSPATEDRRVATDWFENFGPIGLDGVMAKRIDEPYHSGDRAGMVKVKHFREADCVVGGLRYQGQTKSIAAILLGLYDDDGVLHHVGNASAFTAAERKTLNTKIEPLAGGSGFGGKTPGHSRWSKSAGTGEFIPVEPRLVCEVRYDYFTQNRFRHGVKFLRWRPDKKPRACTFDQVRPKVDAKARRRLSL